MTHTAPADVNTRAMGSLHMHATAAGCTPFLALTCSARARQRTAPPSSPQSTDLFLAASLQALCRHSQTCFSTPAAAPRP